MTRGMQKFCSLLLILCVLVSGFPAGGFAVRQDTAEFPEPETAGLSADENAEPGMPPQSVTADQEEAAESIAGLLPSSGPEQTEGPWTYRLLENSTAAILRWSGEGAEITVPLTLGGADVCAIESRAFPEEVSSAVIHGNVMYIAPDAFMGSAVLKTWQGAYAAAWGQAHGYAVRSLTPGTLYAGVKDLSDVQERVTVYSETTLAVGRTEGQRLPVNTVFMFSRGEDEFFFVVTGRRAAGSKVYLTVRKTDALEAYSHRLYEGEVTASKTFADQFEAGVNTEEGDVSAASMTYENTYSQDPEITTYPGSGSLKDLLGKHSSFSFSYTKKVETTVSYSVEIENGKIISGTMYQDQLVTNTLDVKFKYKEKIVDLQVESCKGFGSPEAQAELLKALRNKAHKKETEKLGSWVVPLIPSIGLTMEISPFIDFEIGGSGTTTWTQRTLSEYRFEDDGSHRDWALADSRDLGGRSFNAKGAVYGSVSAGISIKIGFCGVISALQISIKASLKLSVSLPMIDDASLCFVLSKSYALELELEAGLWISFGVLEWHPLSAAKFKITLLSLKKEDFHYSPGQGLHTATQCVNTSSDYFIHFVTGTAWQPDSICFLKPGTYVFNPVKIDVMKLELTGNVPFLYSLHNDSSDPLIELYKSKSIYFDYESTKNTCLSEKFDLPRKKITSSSGEETNQWELTEPLPAPNQTPYLWDDNLTVRENLETATGKAITKQEDVPTSIVLTAVWGNLRQVVFDANGGSFRTASNTVSQTHVVQVVDGENLESAEIPEPDKNLAIFDKWTYDEYGTEEWHASDPVTENLHLYAQYESFDMSDHETVNTRWGTSPSIIGTIVPVKDPPSKTWVIGYRKDGQFTPASAEQLKTILQYSPYDYMQNDLYVLTDCLEHGTLECPDELLYCTGAVTINKIDNKDETSISLLGWSDSRPDSVVSEFVFASSLNGYPVSGEKGFFQGLRAYNVVFAPQPEGGGFVSTDNEAFLNNPWIQTVDLTCTRLVELKARAFEGCTSLTGVALPETMLIIGDDAFRGCTSLTSEAVFGNQVDTIGSYAFDNCPLLTKVTVNTPFMTTMQYAFADRTSIPPHIELTLGDKVMELPSEAFYGCDSLTTITVAENAALKTIGSSAFEGCTGTTRITLHQGSSPSRLQTIGANAFSYCTNLEEMVIPSSVTRYSYFRSGDSNNNFKKKNVFVGTPLRKLTIGGAITDIPEYMLYELSGSLEELVLAKGVTTIGDRAFSGLNDSALFRKLRKVTVPKELTEIAGSAFQYASGLTQLGTSSSRFDGLDLPEGVTILGGSAFEGCTSLQAVHIPSTVTRIGGSAFKGCTALSSVTLSEGLEEIGLLAFSGCSSLTEISIPSTVSTYPYYKFNTNNYAYYKWNIFVNTPIRKLTIGGAITEIPDFMLYEIAGTLEELVLRDGVKTIGRNAFHDSDYSVQFSRLKRVTVPDTLETIGGNAFGSCISLTHFSRNPDQIPGVSIPSGITKIDESTFQFCRSIETVTVPSSVTRIGGSAFKGCTALSSVTLSEGLTEIGSLAFSGCSSLTEISIPSTVSSYFYETRHTSYDSYSNRNIFVDTPIRKLTIGGAITKIQEYMLYELSGSLEELVLRDGVKTVDQNAFYISYSVFAFNHLKRVTVPDSLKTIGDHAFMNCSGLEQLSADPDYYPGIYLPDSLTEVKSEAFFHCGTIQSVYVPSSVVSIGNSAFKGCTALSSVTLSEGLKSIGSMTFAECSSLREISIPSTVSSYYYYPKSSSYGSYYDYNIFVSTPIRKLTLGGAITNIPEYLLYELSGSLEELILREGVRTIGQNAFYGSSGTPLFSKLRQITLPDSLTGIGNRAFYRATALETIYAGANLSSIGSSVFPSGKSITFRMRPDAGINDWLAAWCASNGHTYTEQVCRIPVTYDVRRPGTVEGAEVTEADAFSLLEEPEAPEEEGYLFLGWFAPGSEDPWNFDTDRVGASALTLTARWLKLSVSGLYRAEDDHAVLLSYAMLDSDSGTVVLPSVWQGLPVTEIADGAFSGEPVTRLVLPSGVAGLTASTFAGADSLEWIMTPSRSVNYRSRNGVLYSADGTELVFCPSASSRTSFTVPDGVTRIAPMAFADHPRLKTLTLNEGLTEIGAYAFLGCSSITALNLPDSLLTLGTGAFMNCAGLASVQGGASLTVIGDNAFAGSSFCVFCGEDDSALILYASRNGRLYNLYTVSWQLDGTEVLSLRQRKGSLISEPVLTAPENRFLLPGWFTDPEFETPWQYETALMPAGDLVLYARTVPLFGTEAVTLEAEDPESEPLAGISITGYNGTSLIIRIPETLDGQTVLTVDGSVFPAGSELHLPGSLARIDAAALEGFLLYAPEGSRIAQLLAAAGLTVRTDVYTLSFNANGGTLVPAMELAAGTALTALPETVQDNMEFLGWFLDAEKTQPALTAETPFRMPDQDTLLYASWSGTAADRPFLWEQRGEEIIITGSRSRAEVVIPAAVNGLPVTAVADNAFRNDQALSSLTLPEGLVSVGNYAFCGSSLADIDLPDSVTGIGSYAFAFCKNLTVLSLPAGLTRLSEGCLTGAESLMRLTLPAGLTAIDAFALSDCRSLNTLTLPDSVGTLGRGALQGMTNLKTLTLGAGLQTLHSTALDGCASLSAIRVSESNPAYTAVDGVLYSSDLTTLFRYPQARQSDSFTLPAQVAQIGPRAFSDAVFLKQIVLPEGLVILGEEAFRNAGLTQADLSATALQELPDGAFDGCASLTSVLLPASLASIGNNAFRFCSALPELDVPDTVAEIGANAFWPGILLTGGADSEARRYAGAEVLPFRIRGDAVIPALNITLSKESLTLMKGTGYTLQAAAEPADTTDLLVWTSADPQILRIDDGYIRPLRAGSTEIIVTAGSAEAQIPVEVIDGASFEIETPSCAVFAGQTVTLTFRAVTDNVEVPSVIWTCDDPAGAITGNILSSRGNGIGNVSAWAPDGSVQSVPFAFLDPSHAMNITPNMQVIEPEAFRGMAAVRCVIFAENCTAEIGENAFADCPNLSVVCLPDSVTDIHDTAFGNCPALTIVCRAESAAADYAAAHEIPVFLIP